MGEVMGLLCNDSLKNWIMIYIGGAYEIYKVSDPLYQPMYMDFTLLLGFVD